MYESRLRRLVDEFAGDQVQNRTDSDHVVSATVADPDGEVLERVTDERVSANVGTTFESTGYGSGPYTVRVRGESWATSGLWDPGVCSDYAFTTTLEEADGRPAVTATAACTTSE